jgi:hypothetical protein
MFCLAIARQNISPNPACLLENGGSFAGWPWARSEADGNLAGGPGDREEEGRDRKYRHPWTEAAQRRRGERAMPPPGPNPSPSDTQPRDAQLGSVAPVRRGHPHDPGRVGVRPPGQPGRLFVTGDRLPLWLVRSWGVCGSLLMIAGARLPTPWSLACGTNAFVPGWKIPWRGTQVAQSWVKRWPISDGSPDNGGDHLPALDRCLHSEWVRLAGPAADPWSSRQIGGNLAVERGDRVVEGPNRPL